MTDTLLRQAAYQALDVLEYMREVCPAIDQQGDDAHRQAIAAIKFLRTALAQKQEPRCEKMTEEKLREVLMGTNHLIRNAMHGTFWPELEQACRAVEAAALQAPQPAVQNPSVPITGFKDSTSNIKIGDSSFEN